MAVNFPGSRTAEYRIDPLMVKVHADLNGRFELPEIDTLVDDMLSRPDGRVVKGQTTPVIIRKDGRTGDKETPVLVAGHRRLRAILKINEMIERGELSDPAWTLRCCYMQLSEVEALAVAVSENHERAEATPMDDAFCVKQFLRLGQTYEWIAVNGGFFPKLRRLVDEGTHATELKKAIARIKKWERLLDLVPEAQAEVASGRIKPTAAQTFAKLEAKRQRELLARPQPPTAAEIKSAVAELREPRPAKSDKLSMVRDQICMLVHEGELPSGLVVDEVEPVEALEAVLLFLRGVCDQMKGC